MKSSKYVYAFGNKSAEGNAEMKVLLGGKGANLAEMNLIGLPVPPGFTITTEACNMYYHLGREKTIKLLINEIEEGVRKIEKITGKKFGDPSDPLLLSVRSGARASMPGMMDTVLNLGLNEETVEGFALKTGNHRAAWDSYRRFIQMYGDVVMGMKPKTKEDIDPFELIIEKMKKKFKIRDDREMTVDQLKKLSEAFAKKIREKTGEDFPQNPWQQLIGSITSVFDSWMNKRAKTYRRLHGIPSEWGTAVNVQAMVFGNMGESSATGVAFTRDPATGENRFTGEYLIDAQGEDVVAGIRTPQEITLEGSRRWAKLAGIPEKERKKNFASLEETMPEMFGELMQCQSQLEAHYRDMQDLEFTIQEGKLWILQTRNGKRTGKAMVRIAMEMRKEGMLSEKQALLRIEPGKLDELLHPVFEEEEMVNAKEIAKGLPASPGAASGRIVFFAEDTEKWVEKGKQVILVRMETSPEDIQGMHLAEGILTSRGGMTSHAAVVARGMGTCCVSGAGSISIDYVKKTMTIGKKVFKEGDWISLNGSTGQVFKGKISTVTPTLSGDFAELMKLADKYRKLGVRANADTPVDALTARKFGAEGIGLCRTEHMFFDEKRIMAVREMILSESAAGRRVALNKILPYQRKDFEALFKSMKGNPVTIRLLDPPLHEFLPTKKTEIRDLAKEMGISYKTLRRKINDLQEVNPMLGHRGCRLANTYPEITIMQVRAILEAALNLKQKGINVKPEIMVPLTSVGNELNSQIRWIKDTANIVFREKDDKINFKVGTMIEVPRACVVADRLAHCVDFFSFGTNDLTQMTFGFSRDDVGKFLPVYVERNILFSDPFQTVDQFGVGELVKMAIRKGVASKPDIKLGICGEHGGDPASIEFFHKAGLQYVSCSPFRVPVARLVAAQVAIKEMLHIEEEVVDQVDNC